MKIHFHGAAHEVTGSKHLLEINGKRILLDCGMFQGRRKLTYEKNKNLPFDVKSLDAVILSHAHIDHSGNLPTLAKNEYSGRIYCTRATKDVADLMLRDAAHIQELDAEYVNRHKKQMQPTIPIEPLYTMEDAERAISLLEGRNYYEPFEIFPGIQCTFNDAGHILGSAVTILDFEENGKKKRLAFTGDLGRAGKIILRNPHAPAFADYLITESTYGNRVHEPFSEMRGALARIVNETAQKGGKVIIPSFALERTQELVYDLHVLHNENRIPNIPVFVDSPLATNVTKIYEQHTEVLDEGSHREFLDDHDNPFSFVNLKYTKSVEESKALNSYRGPCIIISASGMCEFGRIRHHLKNSIEDPNNTILIVGFQAEHTLGRRIVEHRPVVKIFGNMYKLRARVEVLNGYSGHGDVNDLMDFIKEIRGLSHVFVVHGESTQSQGLAKRLRNMPNRNWTIEVPEQGDVCDPEELIYEGQEY